MTDKLSVILIGAGNMGGALFASWVEEGVLDPARSAVVTPNPSDRVLELCEKGSIPLNPDTDGDGYDLAVIGVKPNMFGDVLPGLDWPNIDKTLFLSIAAGLPIQEIQNLLKSNAPNARVVRVMPNLPSAVGEGMTLLTAGDEVSDLDAAASTLLFQAAGEVVWTRTEDELDRLMGVSGCGPAFLFLFAEAFEAAARTQGASPEDARLLAEQTIIGAALQLAADGRTAEELRKAVTSPNGTTAAGLGVLQDNDAL
ncbi:MAG: pyrroline-5-carboxylate reductase, partial [Pseudomonadota bacterium]